MVPPLPGWAAQILPSQLPLVFSDPKRPRTGDHVTIFSPLSIVNTCYFGYLKRRESFAPILGEGEPALSRCYGLA